MKVKPILFALIAAAVSGIAGDFCEKGLYALNERREKKKAEKDTEPDSDDEVEEESLE